MYVNMINTTHLLFYSLMFSLFLLYKDWAIYWANKIVILPCTNIQKSSILLSNEWDSQGSCSYVQGTAETPCDSI